MRHYGPLLALQLCCLSAAIGQTGEGLPLPWRVPGEPLTSTLHLRDGQSSATLNPTWTTQGAVRTGALPGLVLTLTPSSQGPLGLLRVTLRNTGPNQRRVQFTLTTPVQSGAEARYWDGGISEQAAVAGAQPERREKADASLFVPLAAVSTGRSALLMALTPDSLCSYWRPVYTHAPRGTSTLVQTIRLVLQAGQTDGFTLCAVRFAGAEFGLMPAGWEAYQQAFPQWFMPTPGVCDNIWGASAEYMTWIVTPQVEPFRRLGVTWDWCYTPFRRVGDAYVRDEEWHYKPLATSFDARPNSMLGRDYPISQTSAAEFRRDRQEYFDQYGLDHGLMFYSLVHWVEKQLALEKFGDSLVVDPDFKTELGSWCRFHDVELSTMPMGGSYGARIAGDMERLAQELPTTGFALDVFLNRERNHSAFVNNTALPGRAWDTTGVYQDIGVPMAQLADRLHAVRLKDRPFERIALVGGHGSTGFHTDATLYEFTFHGRYKRQYPLWRMSMGQKPGVIWTGHDIPNILPQWNRMSRHDFLKGFWGVTDYTRLKCFQWGIFPTYSNLVGVDALQRDMPLLTALIRQGWHPLAPVRVATKQKAYAWPGRYGRGVSHTIAIASPNEATVPEATVSVDNSLLSALNSLYVDLRQPGEWVRQAVKQRGTTLTLDLPRRDLLALRSALGISGDCTARVSEQRTVHSVDVTAEITPARAGAVRLEAAVIPDFELTGLTLGGKPCTTQTKLQAGKNTLRLSYRSTRFRSAGGSLKTFPFLTPEGRIAFVIAAPDAQGRDYARVIRRFRGYFDYYSRQVLKVAEPGEVAVVSDAAQAGGRPCVALSIGRQNTGWTVGQQTLLLEASTEAEAIRATDALLTALDQRYAFVLPFRGGMTGMYHPVQVKHAMIGKTLEQMLAEEGIR